MKHNFQGPSLSPSTACTTGSHAIGDAFTLLRHSRHTPIVLAGAAESCIHPLALAGFSPPARTMKPARATARSGCHQIAAAPTTYSEFTVGATYKPGLPGPIQTLMLRPEIRYDRSLNGTAPFNEGRNSGAVTLAADAVVAQKAIELGGVYDGHEVPKDINAYTKRSAAALAWSERVRVGVVLVESCELLKCRDVSRAAAGP